MDQSCSDELRLLSAVRVEGLCQIELQGSAERRVFAVAFEEIRGVLLMTGADELIRWLQSQGSLWALSQIRDLAQRARNGMPVTVPLLLKSK
jgi:hypothetical protein